MADNDYVISAKITADSAGFEKGIKSAQNSLKGFSSSISSAIKLAGGLFAVGSIAQLGKALSDMSQSYAKATQNIVRGTGAIGEQLKTLQKSVNDSLINGVGRDASELGEMVADLNTRLGVTGDVLTELVGQFDDFSDVTGTDTKTAINSVSDVLAKWNIETEKAVPLMDQLTKASQDSGASVTELTNGLKSGQAVFSQFGMSATQSIAFLGTLKKNGIETSSALVGLKMALAKFSSEGKNAQTAFAEISDKIRNAKTQTEALSIATQTFGQRNGAEFVRILSGGTEGVEAFTEALENAGGTLARTNEASRTSADALKDLKATIAGVFASSGTDNGLRDLIDDVAKAVRNFDFTSIKETFSNIGLFIQGVWEQFKALFNNLSGAVDITGGNFKIFADIIYNNLNHAYQVIQDFVGMISAVLNGDWSVAWEYAKLIVLRTLKQIEESVNNAIALMPNLFNSVIEGYNWVLEQQDKLFLEIFHLPEKYFKSAKLPKFEGKDLIDTKSIEEAIEKVRKTIESKTGKIADKTLADLKRQKEAVHDTTQSVTADIGSLGTAVTDMTKTAGIKVSDFFDTWAKQYEDLAGNWEKTFGDMANIGAQAMGDMFQQIGQDLANGGVSFENYSALAVKAISQVLESLAAQLSATAVLRAANYDYASAALAAAGAAAALVAAGTLAATAKQMKSVSDAAKDATLSVDAFIKKLNELWSGTVTTSAFVTSMSQTRKLLTETNEELDEARYKFDLLYNSLSAKGKEYFKNDWYYDFTHTTNYSSQLWDELQDRAEKLINVSDKYNETLEKMYAARKDVITEQEEGIAATNAEIAVYEELYKSVKDTSIVYENMGEIIKQNFAIIKNEMKAKLQDNLKSLYDSFSNFGKDLGEKMMNGIKEGVSASDFMETIKDYLKEKIITLAVYTESFNDKLAEIGAKMAQAISSGTKSDITKLAEKIEKLYLKASSAAKKASDVIESSFSKINSSATSLSERIKNVSSSINQLKEKLLQQIEALQEKYNEIGEGIGNKFIDSLINGAKKEDFSKELGQYFKEQFIRLTVYTEEFQEKLASYGQRLYSAIMSGSTSSIGTLKSQIDKLYSNANKSIKTMSDYIDTLFGLGETAETTSREVSKLGKVIKDFNDDIKDLGGDVASNLISSLSSGLDVNSALINFKKFLREYIIKSYVYTESMKGEIEKIGEKISSALSGDLTESRLVRISYDVKKTYNKLSESLKTVDKMLDDIFGKETNTVTDNVSKIQKAIDNLKDSLKDLGGDVASNFISSLNSGLDLDSALINFKKFIRNYVVQASVYTESLKDEFSKIGDRVWHYVAGSYPKSELNNIKKEVSSIYGNLAESMKGVDEVLDEIFGKEKEKEVKDTGDTITKELSKIESAIDSFKKTVSDLGGDVASNLIEGLSNGLSQSDFLTNMKNWIKKMLIQSVVYTESMKSQIEEIGKTISNAISGGFTTTSMHEIRRDLSYIFQAATSSMSKIDTVLSGVFDGYATGTTSALRGLHIVGECGPELVRFNGGERVYNNADTMKMIAGAGKTNNMSITFNNIKDTSAFAMMSQLKQYQRELAINGVL